MGQFKLAGSLSYWGSIVLVWIQITFYCYFTNSSRKKKRRVTQGSESKDSDVNKPADSKAVSEVVSGVYHFKSIFFLISKQN